jgi:hypothetical protein
MLQPAEIIVLTRLIERIGERVFRVEETGIEETVGCSGCAVGGTRGDGGEGSSLDGTVEFDEDRPA